MAAGSIIIDLLMKTGSFETDTKRAEKALANFKKEAIKIGAAAGVAFVGFATAMAAGVKQSIDFQDEMSKTAQKAGVTVESLSSMGYAADLAGVSNEALAGSMIKLSKNISDATQGIGDAQKAFDALEISVTNAEGSLKGTDDLILEIAGKFATMEDSAEKTALAVAIFGKSGAALIPFLNQGAAGISELQQEADRLGITLSTETAQAAEAFNDNLTRLSAVGKGFFNQVAQELLPSLVNLSDELFETAAGSDALGKAAAAAVTGIKILTSAGLIIGGVFNAVGTQIGALVAAYVRLINLDFKGALDTIGQGAVDFYDNIAGTIGQVQALWDDEAKKVDSSSEEVAKKISAPMIKAEKKTKDAADNMFKNVENSIKSIFAEVAKLEMNDVDAQLFDLSGAGASVEQLERAKELLLILEQHKDRHDRIADSVEVAKKELEELYGLIEATPTNQLEALRDDMKLLAKAYQDGMITIEQFNEAATTRIGLQTEETTDQITEFWKEAAANMQDAMGNFFFDAMQGKIGDLEGSFKNMIDRMVSELLASQLLDFLKEGLTSGSGGSGASGFLGGIGEFFGGLFNAKGNAFNQGGVMTFAAGGVVNSPTPFTFGGGRAGVMGEAGPEAIIPLKRGKNGELGVQGGGATVTNYFTIQGSIDRRTQQQISTDVGLAVDRAIRRNG